MRIKNLLFAALACAACATSRSDVKQDFEANKSASSTASIKEDVRRLEKKLVIAASANIALSSALFACLLCAAYLFGKHMKPWMDLKSMPKEMRGALDEMWNALEEMRGALDDFVKIQNAANINQNAINIKEFNDGIGKLSVINEFADNAKQSIGDAENRMRAVFDSQNEATTKQRETLRSLAAEIDKLEKMQKLSDSLLKSQEQIADLKKEIEKSEDSRQRDTAAKDEKIEELQRHVAAIQQKPSIGESVFLPNPALQIFGVSRAEIDSGAAAGFHGSLRAWCDFDEWTQSASKNADEFAKRFACVDNAICALPDGKRDEVRKNIVDFARNKLMPRFNDKIEISWDYAGQIYDERVHYQKKITGTKIVKVASASVSIGGAMKVRATVECEP
jgi:hypothetical protein